MSSERSEKYARANDGAGVPSLAVCKERALDAREAAEKTQLGNVRKLDARSARRWSELADQAERKG
jgi:hypothetical protein